MEFVGYASSILMGLVLGLIGGGGSILTVPILVYFFGLSPVVATGTSLFVVGTTAATGAIGYLRKGQVRFKESLSFALPGVVGVLFARSWLLPKIPQNLIDVEFFQLTKDMVLMMLFAFLMLVASLKMIRTKAVQTESDSSKSLGKDALAFRGLAVGLITGFIGAGGGFLIVPALIFLLGLRMPEAVGTSLMIIAMNSLVGFLSLIVMKEAVFDWQLLISISFLAIIGLWFGARLQKRIPDMHLKKSFGWFVLVVGSFILAEQVFHLFWN